MTWMLFVDLSATFRRLLRRARRHGGVTTRSLSGRPAGQDVARAASAAPAPGRYRPPVTRSRYDVVVVGGGHNGLVAAAYLARAGRSVLVLERLAQVGGAAVSRQVFEGVDVRLSAYSYLVSLLPDRIVDRPRPGGPAGRPGGRLLHGDGARRPAARGCWSSGTRGRPRRRSFRRLTGSDAEFAGWQRFYGRLATLAEDLAPTLTEPLLSPAELAGRLRDPQLWHDLRERPLADVVADHLSDDVVRGRGADRRADRHVRRRARRRRPGRALLPLPPGRQRHGPLAGAGGRHGRGDRRHGGRRPPRGRRTGHPGDGHGPGAAGGRRHRALDRRRRRDARRSTRATSCAAPPRPCSPS